MNKGVALVGGVGLGAALMYIFDPDRGQRRRAQIREKVEAAGNKVSDKAEKVGRDLRDRASSVVAETKAMFRQEDVTDEVLIDRVRARLARLPVESGNIDLDDTSGTVILRGKVLADGLPRLLRAVRFVRGVRHVENQLGIYPRAKGVSEPHGTPQPLAAQ